MTKSGVSGATGPSSPLNATDRAPGFGPAFSSSVLSATPAPSGVAHRAMAKLSAGDARLEEAAAIARTLVDGDDLHRLEVALQLYKRERQRRLDMAPQLEAKGFWVDG